MAIVLPTYNPDPRMFEYQIETIIEQTHRSWACLICDDGSDEGAFEQIESTVGDDARFVVHRSERRLGFYRNYERALSMVPETVDFVALADQDDRWRPEKLETLIAALGPGKVLAYSNMHVVHHAEGQYMPLYDTYWDAVGRPNQYRHLDAMLIANSITGAAALFRRRLLSYLLPMPHSPGPCFHDHWLAVIALSLGQVAFVERPLQDYVLHGDQATFSVDISWRKRELFESRNPAPPGDDRRARLARRLARWRAMYVGEVLHVAVFARVARMRSRGVASLRRRREQRRAMALIKPWRGFGWPLRRWLLPAPLRASTMGLESMILRGLLWRRVAALESRLRRRCRPQLAGAGPLASADGDFDPALTAVGAGLESDRPVD